MPLSEPSGDGLRPSSEWRTSLGRKWQAFLGASSEAHADNRSEVPKYGSGSLLVYDFRVLTLQEIGTETKVDTAESAETSRLARERYVVTVERP
jgi:hypothetical protein